MFDIVIRGGTTVTPGGVAELDVGIQGEAIAAVTAPNAIPGASAGRAIDAGGKIVMSGGIDPHVHCGWHMPLPDEDWLGKCYCDYAYHLMLLEDIQPEIFDELPKLIADGYPTVKIFMTNITPSRTGRMVHFGDLWELFKTKSDSIRHYLYVVRFCV